MLHTLYTQIRSLVHIASFCTLVQLSFFFPSCLFSHNWQCHRRNFVYRVHFISNIITKHHIFTTFYPVSFFFLHTRKKTPIYRSVNEPAWNNKKKKQIGRMRFRIYHARVRVCIYTRTRIHTHTNTHTLAHCAQILEHITGIVQQPRQRNTKSSKSP